MPTIYFQSANADRFPLHVVGEESYQDNLQNIVPYDADEKKTFKDDSFTAELILDDENPYDKGNAVRIEIDGQIVGYLSKQHAAKYRRALAAINLAGITGQCAAAIAGKKPNDIEPMNFGVWLDLDLDNLQPEKPSTSAPAVIAQKSAAINTPPPPPASPASQPPVTTPAKKPNKPLLIVIVLVAILVLMMCCCVPFISNMVSPKQSDTAQENIFATATAKADNGQITIIETLTTEIIETPTPSETETPTPTETPAPTLAPVILTGTGDDVVNLEKWAGAAIAQIKYTGGGNFAVINYNDQGKKLNLLVNEIGDYNGTIPLDFLKKENTTRFEITASGPWEIQIIPIEQMRVAIAPGTFEGTGSDVIRLGGGTPDLLKIDAAQTTGNFAIWAYGDKRDLLVNEIGPYTGKVIVANGMTILVITATGRWSIEVTAK